jgi:hypothetical protein
MKFLPCSSRLKLNLLLVVVLLIAFALRLINIDQVPAGLSHDEAYNGVTAMQVLDGSYQIFFEINKGIEPLIIYLEAVAFRLFGIGPVPLRLVNVLFGLLTVVLVYPFTVRLTSRRGALLAMTAVAVSFWAVFVSRLTLRAVLLPPLLLLTFYLYWRGLGPVSLRRSSSAADPGSKAKERSYPGSPASILIYLSLSGLVAGITMYTYLSSRFIPLIVITVFAHQLIRRQIGRWHWLGLILFFLIWAAVFSPLGSYFLDHRDSFVRRSNQVTTIPQLLDGDFGPTLRNTARTLGMFTIRGDSTDRYNLDGRPVFDWINGLLFYLGLAIAIWRLTRSPGVAGPAALLLSFAFFMLVPDFVTDDSPHFLRTIGAMPVVYILWAMGLEATIVQAIKWQKRYKVLRPNNAGRRGGVGNQLGWSVSFRRMSLVPLLVLLLLSLTAFHTVYDYFVRWAAAPNARYIYGADIAELAARMPAAGSQDLTVISAEYYQDLDPFRFSLHFQGQPPFVIWFDGRQSLAFPPPDSNLSIRYAFSQSAPPAKLWASFLQPSPEESGQSYTVYRLARSGTPAQLQESFSKIEVNVNDDLILEGYQVLGDVVSGGKFQVLLMWQALRPLPPGSDYTFLLKMRDSQALSWVEVDANGYRPADWQPGVQALQILTVRLPSDLPPRVFDLSLEVVDRRRKMALPTDQGETAVSLGPYQAHLAGKPRQPPAEQIPNPTGQEKDTPPAGVDLLLIGYEASRRTLTPGSDLELTLHWRVHRQPQRDYELHFFLVNDKAEIVYRWPVLRPANGEWPTSQWPAGYWVQDRLRLPLASTVPVGRFTLEAVLTDPVESGHSAAESGKRYRLGSLIIKPEN